MGQFTHPLRADVICTSPLPWQVVDPTFPIVIFGATAFAAGVLALFLPETQHRKMPDTIEDGEAVPVSLRDGIFKES